MSNARIGSGPKSLYIPVNAPQKFAEKAQNEVSTLGPWTFGEEVHTRGKKVSCSSPFRTGGDGMPGTEYPHAAIEGACATFQKPEMVRRSPVSRFRWPIR